MGLPAVSTKRKGVPFHWGPKQQEALEYLIEKLCEAPHLRHPDFNSKLVLQTDASGYGLGAVLSQHFEDCHHPVVYASTVLADR